MINGKKLICIIPARSGSKGLPRKNVKILSGKPLLAWSIVQAQLSEYLDKIHVSTNNKEIASIAAQYGIDMPFLRPDNLSTDNSPMSDTIIYVINKFRELYESFEYVVLLEPTSPLRDKKDIDLAIELIDQHQDANSLISVGEIHLEHPQIVKRISNGIVQPYLQSNKLIYQRQDLDRALFPYGIIYISKVSAYSRIKTFYSENALPYLIQRWQNYEIDDEIDFEIVELLFNKYKLGSIYG